MSQDHTCEKNKEILHKIIGVWTNRQEDEEFGSVVEVPLRQEEQTKEGVNIDAEQINHSSTEQQGQLLAVLNKYQDRFTEKTGLCTLVEHEIELKPDFRVKEFAAYRIPFAYRPEVE